MKLHLGVAEFPYVVSAPRRVSVKVHKRGKKTLGKPIATSHAPSGGETTADVARFLEDRYHIMEVFFEVHKQEIVNQLTESIRGQLENIMLGAPLSGGTPFDDGTGWIENRFKKFLSLREVESFGIKGVPTKAALLGISHRKKNPNAGIRRPSFIDTGLYESSFKSWVD